MTSITRRHGSRWGTMAGVAADDLTSVDDAPAQPPGAARRSAAEQVVLLDETGRAVGTADKARVHHRTTPLHLAFSCYVFDPSRAVLTTRRALAKKTWPGVWTNSCCGHPLPGEPAATAVRRRLARELGLADVEQVTLVLPQFRYRATMSDATVENELCPVFTARTGARPRPAADEVDDVQWVPWSRFVDQVLHQGRDISPWCREQVAALDPLGPDPFAWPAADPDLLPPAAR